MNEYTVAVFVERGKRAWKFRAYTMWFNPAWSGCNLVKVTAESGTEAKRKAIDVVKARMDLTSQLAPSDVRIVGESTETTRMPA